MNHQVHICKCTDEGYAPDCPSVFSQGGRLLHEISSEQKLKPRVYQSPFPGNGDTKEEESGSHAPGVGMQRAIQYTEPVLPPAATYDPYSDILRQFPEKLSINAPPKRSFTSPEMITSDMLTESNREVLRKYEPLSVKGKTLTEIAIGGFEIDLTKAAEKVRDIIPLPPAKLPKIFLDSELNFNHHFFQGLERLIGRGKLLSIVSESRHFSTQDNLLLNLIEGILKTGFERTDSNITVFTKTVLNSTFEVNEKLNNAEETRGLLVATNIWGFQYLECGQEFKEADLRMWLSICYSHFRNIHFNTFKDSGVPAFVMEGVQSRYEETESQEIPAPPPTRLRELEYPGHDYNSEVQSVRRSRTRKYDDDTRSYSSRRSYKPKQEGKTLGNKLFGM
jgi:hypothetical protein